MEDFLKKIEKGEVAYSDEAKPVIEAFLKEYGFAALASQYPFTFEMYMAKKAEESARSVNMLNNMINSALQSISDAKKVITENDLVNVARILNTFETSVRDAKTAMEASQNNTLNYNSYYSSNTGNGDYLVIKYDNGNKYEGYVSNGNPNGYGVMFYANGDKYEGYFKDGLKNGLGIMYYFNIDKEVKGLFENNILVKEEN